MTKARSIPAGEGRPARLLPFFSGAVFLIVLLAFVVSVRLAGGSLLGALAFPLAALLLCLLPGLLLCRLLCPGLGGGGRLCLGFSLGAALLVLCYAALGSFLPLWACLLPNLLVSAYYLYASRGKLRSVSISRAKTALARLDTRLWALLLIFSAAWFIQFFFGLFIYARPTALGGSHLYHQDLAWSVGNAAAVQLGFPLPDIRMAGGALHYHYFADALTGILAYASFQPAWDAWNYFSWPVYCALLLLGLYHLGKRLAGKSWLALLPAAGVSLLHQSAGSEMVLFYQNTNAVINSYLFLVAALVALAYFEKAGLPGGTRLRAQLGQTAAFALAVTALVWSKSTTGALFLCAVAAGGGVWCILYKALRRGLALMLAAGGGVFALLYFSLISKASNTAYITPSLAGFQEKLLFLFNEHGFLLFLYVVSLAINLVQFKRLGLTSLVLNAFVLGGFLAASIFNHYAKSETYFILAGVFAMWLCIADAFARLWNARAHALRWGLKLCCLVCCLFSFILMLPTARPHMMWGVQSALRCVGLRPPFSTEMHETYFSPEDEQAALWLKENLSTDEVFAINRTSRQLSLGDGIFHLYTAFSERQAFTEGWFYSHQYSHSRAEAIHILEEVNDVIFACDSFAEASPIAEANGISYLVVYKLYKPEGFSGAEPVYENANTFIYRVSSQD